MLWSALRIYTAQYSVVSFFFLSFCVNSYTYFEWWSWNFFLNSSISLHVPETFAVSRPGVEEWTERQCGTCRWSADPSRHCVLPTHERLNGAPVSHSGSVIMGSPGSGKSIEECTRCVTPIFPSIPQVPNPTSPPKPEPNIKVKLKTSVLLQTAYY